MWPFLNNITSCECVECTPSTSICYSGANLPNTGIQNNDTITVALQKIDNEFGSITTTTTTTTVVPTTTTTTTVAPYKVYVALLSNPSGNSIVTTVLQNTLGGVISWGFGPSGIVGTLSNAFTLNKTTVQLTNGYLTIDNFRGSNSTVSTVSLVTDSLPPFFPDIISQLSIEIRVYN